MEKLLEQIKAELKAVEEKGVNASNLELIGKLADIYKDLSKIQLMEGGAEALDYRYYDDYGARGGGGRGGYREGGYGRRYSRMRDYMDRMADGMDQYEYSKERYMHGDDERVIDGLEKIMYAMCMFVESAMDFAESPQEKEIIRKHIQKISRI